MAGALLPVVGALTILVGATPASASICAYEQGGRCVSWYPNADTCRNAVNNPYLTQSQKLACWQWSGFGGRG
jgi:hypothetical protein